MPPPDLFNRDATQQDAAIMRARIEEAFALAPPGSVLADPARREKLLTAAGHVAELTAELAFIHRFVPGRVGQLFGPLISGVEKDPGTGRVGPKLGTAGNFLPSPIGFLDPTAIGLKRNFYIPDAPPDRLSAVDLLPRAVDRIGLGIPEQRAQEARERRDFVDTQKRTAEALVSRESTASLQIIVGPVYPLQRGLRLAVEANVPPQYVQEAARAELARRNATDPTQLTPLLADVTRSVTDLRSANQDVTLALIARAAALDEEEIRINPFLRVGGGSPLPDDAPPVGNLLAEAAKRAPPPMKFLDQARHDP